MVVLIYKELGYQINGAIYEVYNTLGYGHREAVYQQALAEELRQKKIPYKKEFKLTVYYKDTPVGVYIPDFVVDDKIIIELKSLDYLSPKLINQLTNYLKGTNFHLGLLVNFGTTKLEIQRRVWGKVSENS